MTITIVKRFLGFCFLIALLCFTTSASAYFNNQSALGMNTNELREEDSSVPFVDLFRMSLPFEEARRWHHYTNGYTVYDDNGWPIALNGGQVGTRFLNKLPKGTIPEGFYTVLYDGEGYIDYGNDASIYDRLPGKDIIQIKAGRDNKFSASLFIRRTNPRNHLRNIRILMPGGICRHNPFKRVRNANSCPRGQYMSFERHYNEIIFNPDYLNFMKDFKVIRFMNMAGITRNPIRYWHDRPTLNQATWGGEKQGSRGAPVEIMVALANKLHADPWFSMPYLASDDYVRNFANYVNLHLRPGLKVYIEYANEAWNTQFVEQTQYLRSQGQALGLAPTPIKAGEKYYSQRSVEVFDIWEQSFGGVNRLVRVMSGWTSKDKLTETLLTHQNAYKKTDAFAIAPYVFGDYRKLQKARSVNQVFAIINDAKNPYSLGSVLKFIKKQAKVAQRFGVDLIAYEGGQGLVIPKSREGSLANRVIYAANRDRRMMQLYQKLLTGWKQAGGKTFVHFTAPQIFQKYGTFGTKEYITQPISKAPKYRAILGFNRHNPCWWQGCTAASIVRHQKPYNVDQTLLSDRSTPSTMYRLP